MKVRSIMKRPVLTVESNTSITDAARLMGKVDVGALPVTKNGKIVGIVTDRDIAIRGVACGLKADSPVRVVMTSNVTTCRAEDDLDDLLEMMVNNQVRRLLVTGEDNAPIGIVSIGDAARLDWDKGEVAETLGGICHPNGLHCQTLTAA